MPQSIQPAVVGATGYAGFELARLLFRHPKVKKPGLFTRAGERGPARLDDIYPHISGNGASPLEPLVRFGVVDLAHGVICDSKSGVSGAGKQPTQKTHFVEVAENLSAYAVFSHRHTGEILEQLGITPEQLIFTPHLLPIPRGILSTIYVRLNSAMQPAEIEDCLRKFYTGSPWVRVFTHGKLPQIQYSLHTNYCDIGFTLAADGKRLVMVSCLDNLMKGAAGQAVQNMNLIFGWNEEEGLK